MKFNLILIFVGVGVMFSLISFYIAMILIARFEGKLKKVVIYLTLVLFLLLSKGILSLVEVVTQTDFTTIFIIKDFVVIVLILTIMILFKAILDKIDHSILKLTKNKSNVEGKIKTLTNKNTPKKKK